MYQLSPFGICLLDDQLITVYEKYCTKKQSLENRNIILNYFLFYCYKSYDIMTQVYSIRPENYLIRKNGAPKMLNTGDCY